MARNQEKIQAYQKKYRAEHKEAKNAKAKQYRLDNREGIRMYNKKYYTENKEAISQYIKKRGWRLKVEVLSYYSNGTPKCNSCGEEDIKVLQIDHVKGNGNKHRKTIGRSGAAFYRWLDKQNYPGGFQVLCANCNIRKLYTEYDFYCDEI